MTSLVTRHDREDPAPQAAAAAIEQADPAARAGAWRARWLRARFGGIGGRERWGYGVWLSSPAWPPWGPGAGGGCLWEEVAGPR